MSISRWDPWGDITSLREAMNQLFEDGFARPRNGAATGMSLAVDVQETADSYIIHTSVPGVQQEDVSISLLGSTISIRGERKAQKCEENDGRWLIRERQAGAFTRSITLPGAVDGEGAQADFVDGVLTITLPKAERDKVRTIQVRGAQHQDPVIEAESTAE
jgi:HSP20 family protein